jgi:hypothetical protein
MVTFYCGYFPFSSKYLETQGGGGRILVIFYASVFVFYLEAFIGPHDPSQMPVLVTV